jgi:hypothetical protein
VFAAIFCLPACEISDEKSRATDLSYYLVVDAIFMMMMTVNTKSRISRSSDCRMESLQPSLTCRVIKPQRDKGLRGVEEIFASCFSSSITPFGGDNSFITLLPYPFSVIQIIKRELDFPRKVRQLVFFASIDTHDCREFRHNALFSSNI